HGRAVFRARRHHAVAPARPGRRTAARSHGPAGYPRSVGSAAARRSHPCPGRQARTAGRTHPTGRRHTALAARSGGAGRPRRSAGSPDGGSGRMKYLRPVIILAGLIAVWQIVVWTSGVQPFILPAPARVLQTLIERFDIIWPHAQVTALEIALGILT